MSGRRIVLSLWLLLFPIALTGLAALVRQAYPWQATALPWFTDLAVVAAVGFILGRALGGRRQ